MGFIFAIVTLGIIWYAYKLNKIDKTNRHLNEVYNKRYKEEERGGKTINEEPDNVIFQSELTGDNMPYTFIGRLNELGNRTPKNGDLAYKDGCNYLYKDGKWFKIIDDVVHLREFVEKYYE